MGLLSSKSSSQNITDVDNTSAGAQDGSTAVSLGEGAQATFTDQGAFEKSVNFAQSALDKSFSAAAAVASIGSTSQKEAAALIGEKQSGGADRLMYLVFAGLAAFVLLKGKT